MIRQLLYTSSTSRETSIETIDSILAASRKNNTRDGITGVLLYIDGGFMQVLEGEPATVTATFERIRKDARHWNTGILLDRTAERAFSSWTMGFIKPSEEQLRSGMFQLTKEAMKTNFDLKLAPELMVLLSGFYRVQAG
jgi:hypothetical protein